MIKKFSLILIFTSLYAFIRYVIFGHVSLNHIPVYLLNKSISMASVLFLLLTAINYVQNQNEKIRFWGMASLHSAYLHILLSLAILSREYYPKFFEIEKMNLTGELTILFGVFAAYCLWRIRGNGSILQIFASLFIAGHLIAMGFTGWLTVEKWYGGMPPISLLSFIFIMISVILFSKRKNSNYDQ